MVVEVQDLRWSFEGLTPRLQFYYTIHNRGLFRTGPFSFRIMAWRERGEYLFDETFAIADIAPGEQYRRWRGLSAEQLRGATEINFYADPRNRIAESNKSNNNLKLPIPPVPR